MPAVKVGAERLPTQTRENLVGHAHGPALLLDEILDERFRLAESLPLLRCDLDERHNPGVESKRSARRSHSQHAALGCSLIQLSDSKSAT